MMESAKVIKADYDLVVVGGGLTGLCAALASARNGAKTALVQDRPVLGGNASSEVRMHICGATDNMEKPELAEGGIVHELMLANKRVNDSYNYSIWDAVLFDAAKKESNLTLYLNTTMFSAVGENEKVRSIRCYQMTTEKMLELTGRYFADCTGNGTLCAFVGAEFRTGSEAKAEYNELHAPEMADQYRMGNTLLFKAADVGHPVTFIPPVDSMKFTEEQLRYRKHSNEVPKEVLERASENEMRMLFDGYAQDYGYWWIEIPGISDDIIDEYEEIRDQLVSAVYGVWDHIKNGGDHGADNYELVWVGMLPGVRESRRIECDYMLTENDALENRRFQDKVAYGGWHIDNHVPGGLYSFDKVPAFVYGFPGAYDIPYRSYCVKGFSNLFVGGRCMGASKLGMATSRVMATCAIGGQAIGTAAALLRKDSCEDIREIDIRKLQQTLLKDDCYLPELANEDENDMALKATITASRELADYPARDVVSGVSRRVDGRNHQWRTEGVSQEGEWMELKLEKRSVVSQVQLVFDSDFDVEKKITLSSRRQRSQVPGVPDKLVRDYAVVLMRDGQEVMRKEIIGNYQRLNRVNFEGIACDAVKILVTATNGYHGVNVFEVRIY